MIDEMPVNVQAEPMYGTPFHYWDRSSWIRSKPVTQAPTDVGLPFPISIVPLASHPEVASRPRNQVKLLAYRALAHLKFTTVLELEHVNVVCRALAQGLSPVPMTAEQRHDALRIYCDEGGHALIVELLARDLATIHDLDRSVLGQPQFDRTLQEIRENWGRELSPLLLDSCFVSVSETLITKLLSEVPKDLSVTPAVRQVLRDHAADEGHHREYFCWFFQMLWRVLPDDARQLVGRLLPEFLLAFLGPDRALDLAILKALGYPPRTAARIIRETYEADRVEAGIRHAATSTLQLFHQTGVLSDASVLEHFVARRLVVAGNQA
jgi:hypothetical protein